METEPLKIKRFRLRLADGTHRFLANFSILHATGVLIGHGSTPHTTHAYASGIWHSIEPVEDGVTGQLVA